MRILMDFEMNKEIETHFGIRITDIEEIQGINLTPSYEKDSKSKFPDDLTIELQVFGQPWENWIFGWYNLDGSKEKFIEAIKNYKDVTDKLLKTGYCKITDFKNVTWR